MGERQPCPRQQSSRPSEDEKVYEHNLNEEAVRNQTPDDELYMLKI